jgi:hypothetical protein
MVAQPVVEVLPVKLSGEGIRIHQERFIELDDRGGQNRRAEGFTPATQPVITDDLDQQRTAPFVPGLRIGERLYQCSFESIGVDISYFHSPILPAFRNAGEFHETGGVEVRCGSRRGASGATGLEADQTGSNSRSLLGIRS